jgi:putative membrane protein
MDTIAWQMTWSWFFWVGLMILLFSNVGNWGYTYRAHRRFVGLSLNRDAMEILSQRYASGEIKSEEFHKMKNEISQAKQPSAGTANEKYDSANFSSPLQN